MSDNDNDALIASAAIIISSVLKVCKFRKRQFWVRPSPQAKKKYGITVLMKTLVLNDVD